MREDLWVNSLASHCCRIFPVIWMVTCVCRMPSWLQYHCICTVMRQYFKDLVICTICNQNMQNKNMVEILSRMTHHAILHIVTTPTSKLLCIPLRAPVLSLEPNIADHQPTLSHQLTLYHSQPLSTQTFIIRLRHFSCKGLRQHDDQTTAPCASGLLGLGSVGESAASRDNPWCLERRPAGHRGLGALEWDQRSANSWSKGTSHTWIGCSMKIARSKYSQHVSFTSDYRKSQVSCFDSPWKLLPVLAVNYRLIFFGFR